MPIFEYQCPQCNHRTEILQKNAQAALPACPQCNHPAMQKCLSGFAVGSGRPDKAACAVRLLQQVQRRHRNRQHQT